MPEITQYNPGDKVVTVKQISDAIPKTRDVLFTVVDQDGSKVKVTAAGESVVFWHNEIRHATEDEKTFNW